MSKLIDIAVSHFNSREVRQMQIPEWDNVTVYAKNLSLEDKHKWLKRAKGETDEYLLYAVIFGLVDENGEQVFDLGDKFKLKTNVDPELLSKIANFVLEVSAPTEEEREKNF
jgi:hypothetical protein